MNRSEILRLFGNPPLPCIRDQNAPVLAENALAKTNLNGGIPYEILSVSPLRIVSQTEKCSWLAFYCRPNRTAIPSKDTRSAIRTLLRGSPTSSKETMSGYSAVGGVDYVFIVWQNRRCTCASFDVAGSLMNLPRTSVVIGLPDWYGEARSLHFKLEKLHVSILEVPIVIPESHSLAFLTATATNLLHWIFCANQAIDERYAVAAALDTVGIVIVGKCADAVKIQMLAFLSYIGREAETVSICLDYGLQEDREEMDYNIDRPLLFPTAEEAMASEEHSDQVRCLLDAFKHWEPVQQCSKNKQQA